MSHTDITQRFLTCLDKLIADGKVKSKRHFALTLGYHAQGMSEMSAQRREVPLELIEKAVQKFRFNANYLITGTGSFFTNPDDDGLAVRNLRIVTDQHGNERIVHVPVTAQAGYGRLHDDPVYIQDLPSYQLPDPQFRSGTYRSFEIAGASMEPTFRPNDIVIASFVEPKYWVQAIKDGQIMIIVTTQDVLIKRAINRLKTDQVLECVSDNAEFQPFALPAAEIREIWRARVKMTTHMEAEQADISVSQISQQLQNQQKMLEHLHLQLSQVTIS